MTMAKQSLRYAVFISYAHSDDSDGWVEELVSLIKEEHARFSPIPLRIFFDRDEIRTMADWEHRILTGLRDAELMLALVSPAYFESRYCRKEWDVYLEHELDRAIPGDGIAPVYIITVPNFEIANEGTQLDNWIVNLRQRQYLDLRNWYGKGSQALCDPHARQRLDLLEQSLSERLRATNSVAVSNTTVPPHNRNFVGRSEELRQLRAMLGLGRVGAVTALSGLGGIGKSALAFEYAHAYAGEYPGGRFLIPADGVSDLRVHFIALASYRDVNLTDDERKNLDAAFVRVRAAFELGPRSLLVLDNVDNPALLTPSEQAHCLSASDNVHVLVTTRLEPQRLPGLEYLSLDVLPEEDAIRLLEKHRSLANEADERAVRDIVRRLGGFTLAVELVGVFLWQHPEVSYGSYLIRLEKKGLNALEESACDDLVKLSRHRVKLLREVIEPTLSSLSPAELLAMEYAALLPLDQIALPWLRALVGQQHPQVTTEPQPGYPDPWLQLERRLLGLRLLVPSGDRRIVRIHRLIQEVVTARIISQLLVERHQALAALVKARSDFLNRAWGEPNNCWEIEPLLQYTKRALESEDLNNVCTLASTVQQTSWKLGRWGEARDLVRQAVSAQEQASPKNKLSLARDYSNLATLEKEFGNYKEAHQLLERAIAIEKAELPRNHPNLATRYCNLGGIELLLGNIDAARKQTHRGIEIYEKTIGSDSQLALFYVVLAAVENTAKNYVEAAKFLKHAISIEEKIFPSDYPELARHQADLGIVELSLGHAMAARDLLRKSLPVLEKSLPPDHPSLATVRAYRADVEVAFGNLGVAWGLLNQAVVHLDKANHPDLVVRLFDLGHLARRLGDLQSAQALLRRCLALDVSSDYLCPDVHLQACALLAVVESDLGNLSEAREFIHKALSTLDQSLAAQDVAIYSNLALAARNAMNSSEAHQLLQEAIKLAKAQIATIGNTNEAQVYSNLGLTARDLGILATARDMLRQAVSSLEKIAEPEHDFLALGRYRLGLVESDLGNLKAAVVLMKQAYRFQLLKLGAQHPATQNTARWLAGHEPKSPAR